MTDWFADLPRLIRIGPFDVSVTMQDEELKREDGWGVYVHGVSIGLRTDHPSAQMAVDTVLHEIAHGLYKCAALKPGDSEERVTSALSTGWVQVLRDNPGLLIWVQTLLRENTGPPTPVSPMPRIIFD